MSITRNGSSKNLLVILAGVALILAAESLGLFDGMSNYVNGLFFRLRGPIEPDRRIVIAAIDERSLERLGRWPLARIYYAKLLDNLDKNGVVGFDIIMDEPTGDDGALAAAISRHGHLVLPSYIDRVTGRLSPPSPLGAQRTGHVHLEQDIDGIVRGISHTIHARKTKVPSFSSVLYEEWSGKALPRQRPPPPATDSGNAGSLIQMDFRNINYYGPPGTFSRISFVDIIDGRYPPGFFRGRIILVGTTAEGLDGGIITPFTEHRDRMTGIEAHANILANLIHNNSISAASTSARWIVSLLLSILGLLGFLKTSGRNSLLIWIAGMVAAAAVSFALFSALQLWYSPVLFVISFSFMFVAAQVYKLERSWRELAEARDQWVESFNAIDDAIVLMDDRCRIARMNNAGKTMLEPETLDLLKERGKQLLESDADSREGNAFDTETEVHSENKRYFGIRTLPSRDLEGRCKGVVHVVRDITARRIAEEEKELLQFQLLQSQKMESIGRLAGGIAHDFNNILTVILSCSELVLRKTEDEYQRRQLQIIQDSGNKAATLIRQLLVFSRKEVLELQVVDLNGVVENLGGILERVIGEDVTLRLQTVKGIKPVMADPGHLEQVIMNLSVNARDAMPKGGFLTIETGEIYLDEEYARVHSGVSPGLYVVLTVTDTGAGMTPEVKERIFEPFFTTKKAGQGTGLGMSTVFGIIKQMSGHIHLYSEVGRGSVFKIYFPACSKAVEEKPAASSLILPGGTEAVLIAEDDPVIRQLMLDTLTPLGYRVKVACNGAEAMKIIETGEQFDILLTDVVMPETGGKELAQFFQDKQPGAKVLFMSGYTDEMMIQQGLEQKDLAFVQKPCSPSRLVIKIRRMLDGE